VSWSAGEAEPGEQPIAGQRAICRPLQVGAGVVVERAGCLLLVQRSPAARPFPGAWHLPWGYCPADEPPPVTAVREAARETGLRLRVDRLLGAYFFDDDPRGNGLLLVYEAGVEGGELRREGREVVAVGFFPAEGLPRPLSGGGHDQAIEAWRRRALDRWQPGTAMRYCPHCTHPLEERPVFDRLRLTCPACGFVHFRAPKVGVSVLVEQAGRVLLVQRAIVPEKDKWCLPSGFVEWDEAPEEAAIRECAEETGLEVVITGLVKVVHYTDDFRGPGISLIYHARVQGGILRPGDDARLARFFAPAELPPPQEIAFQNQRLVLEQWRGGQSERPS